MADSFRQKISSGQAKWASGGFGGTGFKFDPSEKNKAQKLADMQRRQYEVDQGLRDAEDFYSDQDDDDELEAEMEREEAQEAAQKSASSNASKMQSSSSSSSSSSSLVAARSSIAESSLDRAKRLAVQVHYLFLSPAMLLDSLLTFNAVVAYPLLACERNIFCSCYTYAVVERCSTGAHTGNCRS